MTTTDLPTCAPAEPLKHEVAGVQHRCALHRDFEIGGEAGVDIALHKAAGKTHHAEHGRVEAVIVRKGVGADEDKGLIAGLGRVGIDQVNVDLVGFGLAEVGDRVAVGAENALRQRAEDKAIGVAPAGECVLAKSAAENVIADFTVEVVGATDTEERVVAGISKEDVGGARSRIRSLPCPPRANSKPLIWSVPICLPVAVLAAIVVSGPRKYAPLPRLMCTAAVEFLGRVEVVATRTAIDRVRAVRRGIFLDGYISIDAAAEVDGVAAARVPDMVEEFAADEFINAGAEVDDAVDLACLLVLETIVEIAERDGAVDEAPPQLGPKTWPVTPTVMCDTSPVPA